MQPTFIIGAVILVIVAIAAVVYLTIVDRGLRLCLSENQRLQRQLSLYHNMLSQVGNMLLEKSGVTTRSGKPVRMHSRVSFISGDLRKEGDVIFNMDEQGKISRTVPICIKTDDNESFMPALVKDIKRKRRKKNK